MKNKTLALGPGVPEEFVVKFGQHGLIAVFSALEPGLAVTVRGDRESGRLVPEVQTRQCLHLDHYLQHPTFGLCHVRVQTWLPFTVEVWLNGREWLARQMDATGLAYVQRDNTFTDLADASAAQALLDQTHPLHAEITAPLPDLCTISTNEVPWSGHFRNMGMGTSANCHLESARAT